MNRLWRIVIVVSLALAIFALMQPAGSQITLGVPGKTLSYKNVVEDANSIIMIFDNQSRVTFINDFGKKYFGYSEGELLGKSFIGTIIPPTGPSGELEHRKVNDILAHPELYISHDSMAMRKNGEQVGVLWSNRVLYDDKGNAVGCIAIGNVHEENIVNTSRRLQ